MKNIAVILASGTGSRFGSKLPKQFVRLAGKPIIQYTIEVFNASKLIDEIIIVTKEDYIDDVHLIINAQNYQKVSKVIAGGTERYDSTLAAINAIQDAEANILIHDAVRPFISQSIINGCISALDHANVVDVVVPAIDTIVQIKNNYVEAIPDRRFLNRGQTPQGFKKTVLQKAYQLFLKDTKKIASDDCGIVLKYLPNEKIITVPGEEKNFKITHQQDIYLADNLIKDGITSRLEHDMKKIFHTLQNKVVVIIGASSGIGKDLSTLCHDAGAIPFSLSRRLNGIDITKKEILEKALENIFLETGKIDYVINTAGLLNRKPLMTMSDNEVYDSYMTNYIGVINTARASFNYLKHSQGMLINFTSSSYTRGRPNYSIYSSSKAAVVNFTQAIAEEWAPHNIKVNAINPERTATPMRVENFGLEAIDSLLTSEQVAEFTLAAMSFSHSGQIYSIKKNI